MKNIHFMLGVTLLTLGFILPATTQAYGTTQQTALRINDRYDLYTITYQFGFLNREMSLPIVATRGLTNGSTIEAVGYDIIDNNQAVSALGNSSALVLSNAAIRDNQYYLPKGKAADFTLVVLYDRQSNIDNTAVKINSLPFTLIDNGKESPASLKIEELNDYVTPISGGINKSSIQTGMLFKLKAETK